MHIKYLSFFLFKSKIEENPEIEMKVGFKDPRNKELMIKMCALYGLSILNDDSHVLFESGYFINGISYS